jgi:hypothetical protein
MNKHKLNLNAYFRADKVPYIKQPTKFVCVGCKASVDFAHVTNKGRFCSVACYLKHI